MRERIKTLRHYRQRFLQGAEFVFRRPRVWMGKQYNMGDPVPETLATNERKLRIFWDVGYIEIAQFEDILAAAELRPADNPASVVVELAEYGIVVPDGVEVERAGTWYEITLADGRKGKVNGREEVREFLADPDAFIGEGDVPDGVTVEERGGGWYDVFLQDGTEHTVRGKDALREYLAGISAEEGAEE